MTLPEVPGYRIECQIGAGGGGAVYAGERIRDGRPVAVKVVAVGEAQEADRAARELGLMQTLAVEHLVPFHEALSLLSVPALAIVMDLMDGGSLQDVLSARGHLSLGETVTVVSPIARALASLHSAGVVHADVSPGNVLFDRQGRPALADLGVARLAGEPVEDLFGTSGYTAPEVEFGAAPTAASDVYAVGALAWFSLTGSAPPMAALRGPLAEELPGITAAAAALVDACLSPDPADRPRAADAALGLFDAAPAEPLRIVTADDEVAQMTRRIRAAAQSVRDLPAPAGGTRARLTSRGEALQVRAFQPWFAPMSGLVRWVAVAVLLVAGTVTVGWDRIASAASAPPESAARSAAAATGTAETEPVATGRGQAVAARTTPARLDRGARCPCDRPDVGVRGGPRPRVELR